MSTLTRRSSGNRVPDYKDYMNFVSAYRKPEVSDVVTGKVCDSYSSFLEKTKTKKYSSVKPPVVILGQTPNEPTLKPTVKVKTEIFLEINDAEETPKTLEFTVKEKCDADEDTVASGQVEARKKMFEGRTIQENKFPSVQNGNKILTLKRKIESNNTKTTENGATIVPKEIINKINSGKFEPSTNHHQTKNNTKTTEIKSIELEPSPTIISIKPKENNYLPTQISTTDGVQDFSNFHEIEKRNNELQADVSSKQRLIGQLNETLKFKTSLTLEPEEKKIEDVTEVICVKNIPKEQSSIPPPPPPPMPNGFRSPINKTKISSQETNREKNNKSPPFHPTHESDSRKNQKSSTLERTNPLVRKLAYGAMLDMYGAYHEKANTYVSTLPRQHVRKDNGLQKIIDSIASQGGLDKLSGRSNPKAENE